MEIAIFMFMIVFIVGILLDSKPNKSYKKTKTRNKNYTYSKINTNAYQRNFEKDFYQYTKKKKTKYKIIQDYKTIAKHFNTDTETLKKALFDLEYIEKNNFWTTATEKGKQNGAIEKYNEVTKKKYVIWNEKILQSIELEKKIQEINNKPKKMTQEEKNKKGRNYELYIKKYFEKLGWNVGDHSKAKGKKDKSIDLIASKDDFVYFIQCKNWEKAKLDHKEVKAIRTDIRDYLENENPMLKKYIQQKKIKTKILYVLSNDILSAGAKKYIQEHNDKLEYQVIPMKD